ncbi:MAG: MerR family transcriptional regulator [Clostridium sp.]
MNRKKLLKNEVIQLFNTTLETLRHYEQKGILRPEIGENNYRYYDFEDLQKLRQIFLFRDLEVSIEEMKQLDDGLFNKKEYIELLKTHRLTLKQKIERFQSIEANIIQLIDLLDKGEKESSYLLRLEQERQFHLLNPFEAETMTSPKAYYDRHQSLIKTNDYSERSLQIVYDYDTLNTGEFINCQLCIELPIGEHRKPLGNNEVNFLSLPKGSYLSIFYSFKHGKFDALPKLKEEIDLYLQENNLSRIGNDVIEKEHPELSLFLDEDILVFELQIRVKKDEV